MKITIYQVDAFTSDVFCGNPAAVCPLEGWIDDCKLQSIAAENNLSETAFLVPNEEGFDLRWFTPNAEVALCGHATLASAFVLFHLRGWPLPQIRFQTRQSGQLVIEKRGDLLEMDFPARPAHPITPPDGLEKAFGVAPRKVYGSAEDLLVVLDSEKTVREVQPDFFTLEKMDYRGTIITAPGERCDFVSRFFAPLLGIPEDPVTGSAHCVLIPYWAGILGKKTMYALQVSKRGGKLFCTDAGDRVKISGQATLYMEGTITL
jgi:PhzF family phenazine biosynthesis protein